MLIAGMTNDKLTGSASGVQPLRELHIVKIRCKRVRFIEVTDFDYTTLWLLVLASFWAATLSGCLAVFDHLVESGLCLLHQRGVRSAALFLRPLLFRLIKGLRSLGLRRHLDFTVLIPGSYAASAPPASRRAERLFVFEI